jgi:hypothetical protein
VYTKQLLQTEPIWTHLDGKDSGVDAEQLFSSCLGKRDFLPLTTHATIPSYAKSVAKIMAGEEVGEAVAFVVRRGEEVDVVVGCVGPTPAEVGGLLGSAPFAETAEFDLKDV